MALSFFASCALPGLGGERLLLQPEHAPIAADHEPLSPSLVSPLIALWLRDATLVRDLQLVLDQNRARLFVDCSARTLEEHARLIGTALRDAIELGSLVVLAPRRPSFSAPTKNREPRAEPLSPLSPRPLEPKPLEPKPEEHTWFSVRVLDEVGAPIDDLELVIDEAGTRRKIKTNGSGVARLEDARYGFASVSVASIKALRQKLAPRWSAARTPKHPEGPQVFVNELGPSLEAIGIEAEVPATLVITPYFRCHEIPGAHFEFGRSFVRREAIAALAPIAEDLHGEPIRKAMIFAHTDKSGTEALNKELSERRARALFALFTHDAAAWEELFTNKWSGGNWSEKWGTREIQHMLSALHVRANDGQLLEENGQKDARTVEAIKRFQRGDYPDKPSEQAALVDDGIAGPLTRRELFLAYAKRISREPVPKDRIAKVNGEDFMGCGEYNPFTISAKDAESRRAIVFLFDAAAEPRALPCKLRSLGPCRAQLAPEPSAPDPEGKPPYRCQVYRDLARRCPCNGGADLSHDLILQLPLTLSEAGTMPHVFVLESEDETIVMTRALASQSRAHDEGFVELFFPDLPPAHAYRLRCEGTDEPHVVFDYTPYEKLGTLALDPESLSPSSFYGFHGGA